MIEHDLYHAGEINHIRSLRRRSDSCGHLILKRSDAGPFSASLRTVEATIFWRHAMCPCNRLFLRSPVPLCSGWAIVAR